MIRLKKILFPTDFSESSMEALKYALSFAKGYKARLTVLHVINEKIFSEGLNLPRAISIKEMENEMEEEAKKRLKVLIPSEESEGIEKDTVILKGNPFLEIIRYSRDSDTDIIIMGSHGHSGFEHIIFGSTAEKVVRKAPCPVLTVKPSQREFVMP